jgi:hypothetical protein
MRSFSRLSVRAAIACLLVACSGDASGPSTSSVGPVHITIQNVTTRQPSVVSVLFGLADASNQPVTNFSKDSLVIYEDDKVISKFEAAREFVPKPGRFTGHVFVVLDLSGSVLNSGALDPLKQSAEAFVRQLLPPVGSPGNGEIDLGVWWFDGADALHVLAPPSSDPEVIARAIRGITRGMSTDNSTNLNGAIVQALRDARNRLAQDRAQPDLFSTASVVLFTDGTDRAQRHTQQEALAAVGQSKQTVTSYTIGLGAEIDSTVLSAYGYSGSFRATDLASLVTAFNQVATRIKSTANSYYRLDYCSPIRAGTHTLKLEARVGGKSGTATARFSAATFKSAVCTPTS